jgi:glutamate-1-semialdehyde 2,1-aminomutase
LFEEQGAPFAVTGCESIFSVVSPKSTPRNFRDALALDHEAVGKFHRAMLGRGILFMGRGTFMLSAAHTDDDLEKTLAAARAVLTG